MLADWGRQCDQVSDLACPIPAVRDPLGGPLRGPDFQNLHRNKRSIISQS